VVEIRVDELLEFIEHPHCLGLKPGKQLIDPEVQYLMQSIVRVTRLSDLICHFEEAGLGIILPDTGKTQGKIIARRMLEQLALSQNKRGEMHKPLWIRIGGVTVPEDCNSINELVLVALDQDHSSVLKLG
jgi:GGDEF domain-containing protein